MIIKMNLKTLDDFDFKGKKVLLRSDLNSDVVDGKVINSERIKESAKTISELKDKGARVVVMAHQGKPGNREFVSLKKHAEYLKEYVGIGFVNGILNEKAINGIQKLEDGDAVLLENVRYEDDEFEPEKEGNKFLKLVEYFDFYVNDAFSVCHRNQTSITLFPKHLKSCAGRLLEKEVEALDKINIKNCLYILAGAKPEDNLKLLNPEKKILAGGVFGQFCLIASGKKLGENNKKENENFVEDYQKTIEEVKSKMQEFNSGGGKILLPVDYAVEVDEEREEFDIKEFPTEYVIYDIGEKTQEMFKKEIEKAEAVYMKGILGFTGNENFTKGTYEILKSIASQTEKGKLFSILGGGHLSDAINKSKIPKKYFGHVSLSGGALLNYIAGKKLVGLELLKN